MKYDASNPFVRAAIAFAGFSLLVLLAVAAPSLVLVSVPRSDPTLDPALIRVAEARPPTNYEIIAARPLFNDGRRADPPPPPPAPPKPPPLPGIENYRLVGLVLSSDVRLALVSRSQGGDLARLRPGDQLDGWTVETVDDTGVTVTGQGNTAHMKVTRAPQGPDTRPVAQQTSLPESAARQP